MCSTSAGYLRTNTNSLLFQVCKSQLNLSKGGGGTHDVSWLIKSDDFRR